LTAASIVAAEEEEGNIDFYTRGKNYFIYLNEEA